MNLPQVPWWAWLAWGFLFAAIEGVALLNGASGDTLTETVLLAVPGWVIYGFLGWLLWHFRKAR